MGEVRFQASSMTTAQPNVEVRPSGAEVGETRPVGPVSGVCRAEGGLALSGKPTRAQPCNTREPNLRRILELCVPVSVVLAECDLRIEAILDMKVGTIIEFDVPFDADLTLFAANRQIGTGQAVKVGENFGLRVAEIGTVKERINALGGVNAAKEKA